jgi:AhpD family alkylhydroperoxidase
VEGNQDANGKQGDKQMTEPRRVTGGRGAAPADDPHPKSGASAPSEQPSQPKRTLTAANFFKTTGNFVTSLPAVIRGWPLRSPKTSAALREKVWLGVTSVNDCRYCKWAHTHWAMDQGVTLEEVNQILDFQIEPLAAKNPAEAAAILFAQHYAEHLDKFDPESIENLRKYYSDPQVNEILAFVRFITFTNLLGNTADAFFSLFRKYGYTPGFFAGVVGAATAPAALLILLVAMFDRQIGMDKLSPWRRHRQDASPNPDSKGASS